MSERERSTEAGDGESPVARWLADSEGSETTAKSQASSGGRLRRFFRTARSRGFRSLLSLPVILALLLGVTLGGAGVWWMSERGGGDESMAEDGYCWGALSEKNARWFLRGNDQRTLADDVSVRGEESRLHGVEPLLNGGEDRDSASALDAHCRLTAEKGGGKLNVTVKVLDEFDAYGAWQRDHLHAGLTPMADGLPGMAGPYNAWLALPAECPMARDGRVPVVSVLGTRGSESPFSVKLEPGSPEYAHAAVSVANAVLDEHGCQTSFPVKKEPLHHLEGDGLASGLAETKLRCGLDLAGDLPDGTETSDVVGGQPDGPIRVCEARPEGQETPNFQLVAINDPVVEEALFPRLLGSHPRNPRMMVVPCMRHELKFTGEALRGLEVPVTKLLREFAEQEARHHGCDPKKIKAMPSGT